MNYKRCNYCDTMKSSIKFHKDKTTSDGYARRCIKCTRSYFSSSYKNKGPHFLYGDNVKDVLRIKQYMKDRTELFNKHGNGWWWGMDDIANKYPSGKNKPITSRKRFSGRFAKEEE